MIELVTRPDGYQTYERNADVAGVRPVTRIDRGTAISYVMGLKDEVPKQVGTASSELRDVINAKNKQFKDDERMRENVAALQMEIEKRKREEEEEKVRLQMQLLKQQQAREQAEKQARSFSGPPPPLGVPSWQQQQPPTRQPFTSAPPPVNTSIAPPVNTSLPPPIPIPGAGGLPLPLPTTAPMDISPPRMASASALDEAYQRQKAESDRDSLRDRWDSRSSATITKGSVLYDSRQSHERSRSPRSSTRDVEYGRSSDYGRDDAERRRWEEERENLKRRMQREQEEMELRLERERLAREKEREAERRAELERREAEEKKRREEERQKREAEELKIRLEKERLELEQERRRLQEDRRRKMEEEERRRLQFQEEERRLQERRRQEERERQIEMAKEKARLEELRKRQQAVRAPTVVDLADDEPPRSAPSPPRINRFDQTAANRYVKLELSVILTIIDPRI